MTMKNSHGMSVSHGTRFTDGIVSRMPIQPIFAPGALSASVDVHLARQQQEQLYDTLREVRRTVWCCDRFSAACKSPNCNQSSRRRWRTTT